jgi:hypothetical protein
LETLEGAFSDNPAGTGSLSESFETPCWQDEVAPLCKLRQFGDSGDAILATKVANNTNRK